MAGFSDVTPASLFAMHPMVQGEVTRVHTVVDYQWRVPLFQPLVSQFDRRCKSPVIAGHQHRSIAALLKESFDLLKFGWVDAQWLFHQNVFACSESPQHQGTMKVVARANDDQIDF